MIILIMKQIFIIVAILAAMTVQAADLATYKSTYEKSLEEIVLSHGMNITKLRKSYEKSLQTLTTKVQSQGDLTKAKAVNTEKERFSKEKTVTAEIYKDSFTELKRAQESYIKQLGTLSLSKAKKILTLAAKYDGALIKLQKSFTKQGNLDEAIVVEAERNRVKESSDVASSKAIYDADNKKKETAKLESKKQAAEKAATKKASLLSKRRGLTTLQKPSGTGAIIVTREEPVTIEAEKYSTRKKRGEHEWQRVKKGRVMPYHLLAYPHANKVFDINEGELEKESPMVSYNVQFTEAGDYYIWIRGHGTSGGNSIALGLDGKLVELKIICGFKLDNIGWCNKFHGGGAVVLKIEAPGAHQINFWMIEDSFRFDKFVITADSDFNPEDLEEEQDKDE